MLACGALVVSLGLQLLMPNSQPLADAKPRKPIAFHPVVAPVSPDYPAILQTPVFSPDRRLSEDDDPAPGAGPLGGFTALGIATGRGFATALLKGPDGVVTTLRPGDSVQGWRLVGISSEKLTFQRDTASHVVPIGPPAGAAAAPQNGNDE